MLLLQVWLTTLVVIALVLGVVAAIFGPPLYRRWKLEQRAEQIRREQAAQEQCLRAEAEREVSECLGGQDQEVREVRNCNQAGSEEKVEVNRWQ